MWNRKTGPILDKYNNIIIDSSMHSVLSSEIDTRKMLELTKLLKHKFNLNGDVKIRFNKTKPEEIKVVFEDNYYIRLQNSLEEHENKRPLDYLKTFGGAVSKETDNLQYLSKSISTIRIAECGNIIDGLKLMSDPSYQDVEERENNIGLSKLC